MPNSSVTCFLCLVLRTCLMSRRGLDAPSWLEESGNSEIESVFIEGRDVAEQDDYSKRKAMETLSTRHPSTYISRHAPSSRTVLSAGRSRNRDRESGDFKLKRGDDRGSESRSILLPLPIVPAPFRDFRCRPWAKSIVEALKRAIDRTTNDENSPPMTRFEKLPFLLVWAVHPCR